MFPVAFVSSVTERGKYINKQMENEQELKQMIIDLESKLTGDMMNDIISKTKFIILK